MFRKTAAIFIALVAVPAQGIQHQLREDKFGEPITQKIAEQAATKFTALKAWKDKKESCKADGDYYAEVTKDAITFKDKDDKVVAKAVPKNGGENFLTKDDEKADKTVAFVIGKETSESKSCYCCGSVTRSATGDGNAEGTLEYKKDGTVKAGGSSSSSSI